MYMCAQGHTISILIVCLYLQCQRRGKAPGSTNWKTKAKRKWPGERRGRKQPKQLQILPCYMNIYEPVCDCLRHSTSCRSGRWAEKRQRCSGKAREVHSKETLQPKENDQNREAVSPERKVGDYNRENFFRKPLGIFRISLTSLTRTFQSQIPNCWVLYYSVLNIKSIGEA